MTWETIRGLDPEAPDGLRWRMAHSVDKTVLPLSEIGECVVKILETEAGASDQVEIASWYGSQRGSTISGKIPRRGRIHRMKVLLVSGTGDQVDPVIERIDADGLVTELEWGTAGADLDIVPAVPIPYFAPGGLRFKGNVGRADAGDPGSDNTIQWELFVTPGWTDGDNAA